MRKTLPWVLSDQPHLRTVHRSYSLRRKMVHCTFVSTSAVSTVSPKRTVIHSRSVHPVFHVSMLEPATSNTFSERIQPAPAPVIIDREPEYEISRIVDSKIDCRRACKLLYKVIWLGYEDTGDESKWIPASELTHAVDLVSDFHIAYPAKPSPLPLS